MSYYHIFYVYPGSENLVLKMTSIENSQSSALSSSNVDNHPENSASSSLNHGYMLVPVCSYLFTEWCSKTCVCLLLLWIYSFTISKNKKRLVFVFFFFLLFLLFFFWEYTGNYCLWSDVDQPTSIGQDQETLMVDQAFKFLDACDQASESGATS